MGEPGNEAILDDILQVVSFPGLRSVYGCVDNITQKNAEVAVPFYTKYSEFCMLTHTYAHICTHMHTHARAHSHTHTPISYYHFLQRVHKG